MALTEGVPLAPVYQFPVQAEKDASLDDFNALQLVKELGGRAFRYTFYKLYHEPELTDVSELSRPEPEFPHGID